MTFILRAFLAVLPWLLAQGAQAADPAAPALRHDSVFQRYQRFEDQAVGPWQKANETVGRIGGWRSYARETANTAPTAQTLPSPPAGPSSAPGAPSLAPQTGHGGHGHGHRP